MILIKTTDCEKECLHLEIYFCEFLLANSGEYEALKVFYLDKLLSCASSSFKCDVCRSFALTWRYVAAMYCNCTIMQCTVLEKEGSVTSPTGTTIVVRCNRPFFFKYCAMPEGRGWSAGCIFIYTKLLQSC